MDFDYLWGGCRKLEDGGWKLGAGGYVSDKIKSFPFFFEFMFSCVNKELNELPASLLQPPAKSYPKLTHQNSSEIFWNSSKI